MVKPVDKKRAAQPRKSPRRKTGGSFLYVLFFMMIGIALVLAPALAGLVFIGMLPTVIMMVADIGALKSLRLSAMAAFNLSGVAPFAFELWRNGLALNELLTMLANVMTWLIMFGAAAIGLLMLWICPVGAAALRSMINTDKSAHLVRQRKALIAEWGDGVTGEDGAGSA